MEDIGTPSNDMQQYTKIMAETLAILHWVGEMDGNDVEFVLAHRYVPTQSNVMLDALGEHIMWLLGFDVCRQMSMDEAGVRQAVTAFLRNDPFHPRPNDQPGLWEVFRELPSYQQRVCGSCFDAGQREERQHLSNLFIDLVEQEK